MKEQWMIATKRADFNKIAQTFQISPVLARLMRNRDLVTEEEMWLYLFGSIKDIPSPDSLKDIRKAASILQDKIQVGKKIRIISDYDVDGVSSNYILYKGLKRLGAMVDYRIPDRVEDGYGINENMVTQAKEDGVDTILTCDNGIAAINQIALANELGLTVIVTDHHEIPYEEVDGEIIYRLPPAAAVVNPKQKDCSYPNENICGAVVALKLMQLLFQQAGVPQQEFEALLPMAAMATVCDVMPLKGENRILVKEGLKRMEKTEIIGLQALIETAGRAGRHLTAYDMGFVIGPCINATGRLKTAEEAMDLLLCKDYKVALEKARELTDLNTERKELTRKGVEDALRDLEESGRCQDDVLVVFLPDCHESIAGIIAGRVREHYNKPTFVLTRTKEGVKGSGRSIEAYSMFDEMTKVKELFTKFGGHPMAAGLSLEERNVEELRRRLNENSSLTEEDFVEKVVIDVALPFSWLSESFLEELNRLEPFGTGNKKPLFAQKNLEINSLRVLGNSGRCIKLYVKDASGMTMEAMYFGDSAVFLQEMEEKYGNNSVERAKRGMPSGMHLHVTYQPRINEWNGNKVMQIVIENYQFC